MITSWIDVASEIRKIVAAEVGKPTGRVLDDGQCASLSWIADRLPSTGLVLADEVGTGKTRIACAVVKAVVEAGGRVAVVVPHGLMHQWQSEARCVGLGHAKVFTSIKGVVEDAKTKLWEELAPSPNDSEWLLVSHGFRSPLVYEQSRDPWRVALPACVLAHLARPSRQRDGRTREGRVFKDMDEPTRRLVEDIVRRLKGREHESRRRDLRSRLQPFRYDPNGTNEKLIKKLREDEGRAVVEELLSLWFGEFDLVVIDEAHKSRGDAADEEPVVRAKVLPRLLENILKQPEHGRRLCLTATPMELDLEQWTDLLQRATRTVASAACKKAIDDFKKATREAAIAPDESCRLDRLKTTAKAFETALVPYVSRRRRDEAEIIGEFRQRIDASSGMQTHPHRRIERLPIDWRKAGDSGWRDVLFAAECMRQAALGLESELFESALHGSTKAADERGQRSLAHQIRQLHSRIAAGHIGDDISAGDLRIEVPANGSARAKGKLGRIEHWRREIQNKTKKRLDDHPRIVEAVREIESWTDQGEKVLVFGVFLKPLKWLRDVLNVRAALRAADRGKPNAHKVWKGRKALVLRQFARMREENAFSGDLQNADEEGVMRALRESYEKYREDRKRIDGHVSVVMEHWKRRISSHDDHADVLAWLRKHLVAFLLEEQVRSEGAFGACKVYRLAARFWRAHVVPELAEVDPEGRAKTAGDPRVDKLRQVFCDDANLRMRTHAVLLSGQDRWSTRRYVQAAFNRPTSSPRVLIAQSQVGREGLNLHEACRVVLQFHAEWNPAVLEQQIGRVDRKGSLWEKMARRWLDDGARGEPPFIEVRQLVFEGTYDELQWDRVGSRQHLFDASLFGSLLPPEALERVPPNRRDELLASAPSFRPRDEYWPKSATPTRTRIVSKGQERKGDGERKDAKKNTDPFFRNAKDAKK